MGIFDDVKIGWKDKDYVIPAKQVLGAIARIEECITLPELAAFAKRGTAPLVRLSQAYGSVLRYAGADVSDEEVYEGIFASGDQQTAIVLSVQHLIEMMVPPSERLKAAAPGKSRKAAASSSRKRTR